MSLTNDIHALHVPFAPHLLIHPTRIFPGHEKGSCEKSCSGHGLCRSMSDLASTDGPLTNGVGPTYTNWEAEAMYLCDCDWGWTSPDCSMRTFGPPPPPLIPRFRRSRPTPYDMPQSLPVSHTPTTGRSRQYPHPHTRPLLLSCVHLHRPRGRHRRSSMRNANSCRPPSTHSHLIYPT